MEAVSFRSLLLGSSMVTVMVAPSGAVCGMTISSSLPVGVMMVGLRPTEV